MKDEPPVNPEADEPQLRHHPAKRDEGEAIVQGLVESDPSAFLNLLGIPVDGPVTVIETGIFPHILPIDRVLGRTPRNRGHAAAPRGGCLGGRPRRLRGTQRGKGIWKRSNSSRDQPWSVRPAAMAGVR